MNLKVIFPIIDWITNYKKEWFKGDLSAGFTIGIMLIPQGIAYAMIAELPPIYGLYTAMIPQLVYAVFGTSRQLAVGPVALDSLIVATGVAAIAEIGTENYVQFAILLAFMVGSLQVFFGVFKLGFLVNFLSKPVINGFTSAAAIIIGFSQLNNLLGLNLERSSKIQYILYDVYNHLTEINLPSFFVGISAILSIVFFKKYVKKIPATVVVILLSILVAKILNLEQLGVKLVGEIPNELPKFTIPTFDKEVMLKMIPVAFTLSFIGFLEAISLAKAVEIHHTEYKVKPNKEFIALGLGNIIGSFFQTYTSTGGFSRTAVNNQEGAKTPLSSIVAALVVALTLLFFTPVFYYLPKAVLAAVIMVAVYGLIDFKMPKNLFKYTVRDFLILLATLLITITIGIEKGILTGVILSIVMLIYNSVTPHIAVLGQVGDTHFYRNTKRFKDLNIDKEYLIIRFDSPLYFANATFFKDKVQEFAKSKGKTLKLIIIDGESLKRLDSSAIITLEELLDFFKSQNVIISFAGLKGPTRDLIKKSGLIDKIGTDQCFMSIHEAVACYYNKCNNIPQNSKFDKYINQTDNS